MKIITSKHEHFPMSFLLDLSIFPDLVNKIYVEHKFEKKTSVTVRVGPYRKSNFRFFGSPLQQLEWSWQIKFSTFLSNLCSTYIVLTRSGKIDKSSRKLIGKFSCLLVIIFITEIFLIKFL